MKLVNFVRNGVLAAIIISLIGMFNLSAMENSSTFMFSGIAK